MHLLEPSVLQEALAGLSQWRYDPVRPALVRRFMFADFAQAFAFMTELAIVSEKQDHHPEWFNVYNRVDVAWTSHDVQGVSARDVVMARLCDAAAARRLQTPAP